MKKCWPLFHDWEIVNVIEEVQLKADVYNELSHVGTKPIPPAMRIIKEGGSKRYFEKVCMKCETYVDNIAPQKEIFILEYYNENRRKALAEEYTKKSKEAIKKIKKEGRRK